MPVQIEKKENKRRFRLPLLASYALTSIALLVPAVWLVMLLACVKYGDDWPATCEPVNYAAAVPATAALVLLPLGLIYRERAHRRASRGMWQKVGGGTGELGSWGAKLERTVQYLWGSEIEPPATLISGEMRYEKRGWYLAVKSGRRVWVDRREFWLWLEKVETLVPKMEAGESAIGERRWQSMLGRDLWLAYMDILEAVGAVEYPTDDLRSRRYKPGSPWGRVEEFEKLRPSERY